LVVHLLLVQIFSLLQVSQVSPPVPQASSAVPERHFPTLSQQPLAQVLALQGGEVQKPIWQFSLTWQV